MCFCISEKCSIIKTCTVAIVNQATHLFKQDTFILQRIFYQDSCACDVVLKIEAFGFKKYACFENILGLTTFDEKKNNNNNNNHIFTLPLRK